MTTRNSVEEAVNGLLSASQGIRVLLTELRQKIPQWRVTASIENDHGSPYLEFRVTVPEDVPIDIVKAHLEEAFPWTYRNWKFVPAVDVGREYSLDENSWYRRILL
jgi:hypothetical protein